MPCKQNNYKDSYFVISLSISMPGIVWQLELFTDVSVGKKKGSNICESVT